MSVSELRTRGLRKMEAKLKLKLNDREARSLLRGIGQPAEAKPGFLKGFVQQKLTQQTKGKKAAQPWERN